MPATCTGMTIEEAHRLVADVTDQTVPTSHRPATRGVARTAAQLAVAETLARCGHAEIAARLLNPHRKAEPM